MNALMSLENRVDPSSKIYKSNQKTSLLGNRGILHTEDNKITRNYRSKNWVICLLEEYDKNNEIHKDNTELFFLDEATAFSAGHRPCEQCNKKRYDYFLQLWLKGNTSIFDRTTKSITAIDKIIHNQRIKNNKQVTYLCLFNLLPNGTFIQIEENFYIVWDLKIYKWHCSKYKETNIEIPLNKEVWVTTPKSFVNMYEKGFIPNIHKSLKELITK